MATVASPMYGAHHNGFISSSSATATSTQSQPVNHQHHLQTDAEQLDDDFPLFCRALYDYQAQDASALSFRRNDIIEILTQQESGWWDGLLGDERGWFPSNYVTIISEEEAEAAFSAAEQSPPETQPESMVSMSQAMMGISQTENEEWLEREMGSRDGLEALANTSMNGAAQSNDFWMPQIYYVNTQTGQHSRDLPQESDDHISDSEFAGLTSQSSSRSGTSAGLGLTPNSSTNVERSRSDSNASLTAGFGLPRRTLTPEPWIRKLADDGMSYIYWNPTDNQVRWTRPEAPQSPYSPTDISSMPPSMTRSRSDSQPTDRSGRLSVYSDDSDIQPHEGNRTARAQWNGTGSSQRQPYNETSVTMELTSAERLAQTLQQALAPSPPEVITDLSAIARNAIQAIIDNIQLNGFTLLPEQNDNLDKLVCNVVLAVRNLLYVSAIPTGHIPSSVLPPDFRNARPNSAIHAQLKSAQRKVTATLSKLVLSARAMQYDTGVSVVDTPNRIEGDAEELERAIVAFVLEVQRHQHQTANESGTPPPTKRLHGVFSTANVGLGLVGAGAAGSWRGFGWVSLDNDQDNPRRILGSEVVNEISSFLSQLEEYFSGIRVSVNAQNSGKEVTSQGQALVTRVSAFLTFVSNIHVARHVDIDGIRQESGALPNDLYIQSVEKARTLVRMLETAVQSLYDDTGSTLIALQSIRLFQLNNTDGQGTPLALVETLVVSMKSNLEVVREALESLLAVGYEQAELAQGDYNGSIEWRMSRMSMIDTQFGGSLISLTPTALEADQEDVVDMGFAFSKQGSKLQAAPQAAFESNPYKGPPSKLSISPPSPPHAGVNGESSTMDMLSSPESHTGPVNLDTATLFEDDGPASPKSPPRAAGADKLRKLLGDDAPRHYLDTVSADSKPWYLRPNYDQSEIQMDPDGSVRGGTIQALVERLTAHEHSDPSFTKTFLLTYKSFTTLDELFNLLVQRFRIQAPPNLTSPELEEWGKLKQHVIQMRVLNTLKSMVVDDDVLEKEDYYILDKMKDFIAPSEVSRFAAAKQLMILIERAQKGGDNIKMVSTLQPPPPPIIPRVGSGRKLKLLDIDPLELARQLTILESQLYQKIRPMECLQRSREQKMEHHDNIAIVIQTSNRIADWVADCILSREDSRRRAAAVKQFINVADRCRTLHNFSTMVAITSGLNTPPIRRLKRTWEQVNQKLMLQLGACEMTIDTTKNFNNYRSTMANVTPPCVPFIGVFLTTLQFIQDGNPDNLAPGNLVNFRKRQKAMEVINDIKRWQAQPFNFTPIPAVLAFIDESLNQFSDTVDVREHFWKLSLEREPREREDEKMARLLQESGFL